MYYKFPSTPYIFLDNSIQKKEKNYLTDSEIEKFLSNKITVEEIFRDFCLSGKEIPKLVQQH